jgi:HK97 family phage major capsid protein
MPTLIELRQERGRLITEAQELLKNSTGNTIDKEQESRFDALMADADGIADRIKREERAAEARASVDVVAEPTTKPGDEHRAGPSADEQRAAFLDYVRHGVANMKPEHRALAQGRIGGYESRDLSVGTNAAGGYTVPTGFYQKLTDAQKAYGGMRQSRATILQTESGNPLPFATDNDTSNVGALLAEAAQITTLDPTFAQITLGAYTYTSLMVKLSIQLLEDSAFDLETWLANKLGIRLARATNAHYTVGTGTAQPKGVVTAATSGKVGLVGQTTSVIYDDIMDMIHAVDPAYRAGAQWMFHDTTLKALKKIKDTQGRPLWLPTLSGLASATPDSLAGYPYVINQDMPVMAANAKSILFGDFANFYIRDVQDVKVMRLDERFADFLQVAFLAFQRTDANLIDAGTHPIAYYANSAT